MNYKNSKVNPNIVVSENIDDSAKNFADEFKLFVAKNSNKKYLTVLLSGGSTPKKFFETLVRSEKNNVNWKIIHFFWGDERCVPPNHDESNYLMTKNSLLDHIDIPAENVHRIKGENDPENEAERYSVEIEKFVELENGLPSFDITILGLGTDGHTASIFPDQMNLLNSEKICENAVHPESGQNRITVTGKVLNNSKKIYFLAAGANKSQKLFEIINSKENSKLYPASYIKPISGDIKFFIDREAAKLF